MDLAFFTVSNETTNPPTLNHALRSFWDTRARNRILYGGRVSSKSYDASGRAIGLARVAKLRFLCARQFQNKIEESVYTLLKFQIERFGFKKEFDIIKNKITHRRTGTEFMFYGLWNHIDEIKSLEGVDVLWIEEAHNLIKDQWDILEPTIRKENSEIWIIFNPRLSTDFVYKRFVVNPPPNTVVRQINYDENPFISKSSLDIIDALKVEDYDEYLHIYEGVPKDDDENVIIKRKWITAAIDAHKKLKFEVSGSKRMGFDIADSGIDKCALIYAHGNVALWSDLWKAAEDELLKSCTRAYMEAKDRGAAITYDSIGVGATAGSKFKEINQESTDRNVSYDKFNAGSAVFKPDAFYKDLTRNKDMFANLKAQAWWLVADRFRDTYNAIVNGHDIDEDNLISISSEIPKLDLLIDELSTPNREFDKKGRVMVESKDDLKERLIPSPNMADAFVMAFSPGVKPIQISRAAIQKMRQRR